MRGHKTEWCHAAKDPVQPIDPQQAKAAAEGKKKKVKKVDQTPAGAAAVVENPGSSGTESGSEGESPTRAGNPQENARANRVNPGSRIINSIQFQQMVCGNFIATQFFGNLIST